MKKKTFKIPIYNCTLTVILDKDLSYVERTYKTRSLEDFGAISLDFGHRDYVVSFTDKDHLSNITHEVTHIKNFLFRDIGAQIDFEKDEPEAYLSGYLFDLIYNFLHDKKQL